MIPIVGFGIKGKKILDIRDLVWEYIAEKSFVKKIIKKIFRIIMKSGIKKFDQIIVTNDREKKLLEEKYIARKIDIVPNGISLERYEKLSKIENKLNTHPFTVTYLGNIGFAHNLKLLVSVAKELPDINFVIIGDGMELQDIKTYASKNEISNVHFTGKLDWNEIKPYYEESSVLYAQLQKRLPSAMPSKLFEYASTGLPIIYGGTGHAVSFVNKLEQSMVIEPDDFSALKNAIEEMQDKTLKISEQNRILVKDNYLREASSKKLSQIVSQYIDQKSKG
jgi:glycosyltransferase involved in cell wall biosynthesis